MATHRDGYNPLRPYYIPPSIGEPADQHPHSPGPNPLSSHGGHGHGQGGANAGSGRYTSKARDIFSDLDYKDYIAEPNPSAVQTVKELIDELLWKYTSVLMAQPFEVAKTILQVRSQDDLGGLAALAAAASPAVTPSQPSTPLRTPSFRSGAGFNGGGCPVHDVESDSDADEPAYFTSTVPSTPTSSRSNRSRKRALSGETAASSRPAGGEPVVPAHQLPIRRPDSVFEVISHLWGREGAWGVWKGSNATFLYTVLQSLLENWSRSLLSAMLNVPDLGVRDDIDQLLSVSSPYPWVSLAVAAAAAVATGLVLAPLDLVRTRLIITPTSRGPRRTLSTLRNLPSYLCPGQLVLPTVLHALVHPLLTLSTPLVLRSAFLVDREASPTTFSLGRFASSAAALFVKLPLETVLRRGQAAELSRPEHVGALEAGIADASSGGGGGDDEQLQMQDIVLETVVAPGRFNGVLGTMYTIVAEEGSRPVPPKPARPEKVGRGAAGRRKARPAGVAETVYRRGQGLEGLWRGWKVSWWGLVGLWTAGVAGRGGDGEF